MPYPRSSERGTITKADTDTLVGQIISSAEGNYGATVIMASCSAVYISGIRASAWLPRVPHGARLAQATRSVR
jgi:hypothetical protein